MVKLRLNYYCHGCSFECRNSIEFDIDPDPDHEKECLKTAPKPDSLNCLVNGQNPAWESDDLR